MAVNAKSQTERSSADWVICNLRWLIIGLAVVAAVVEAYAGGGSIFGSLPLMRQLLVLAVAFGYNLAVVVILISKVRLPGLPQGTLAIDALLAVALVLASGGPGIPVLPFALLPALTAALRFGWRIGLCAGALIAAASAGATYLVPPTDDSAAQLPAVLATGLVLLATPVLAGLIGGLAAGAAEQSQPAVDSDRRKVQVAKEHSRIIFELANTLSATLNYQKVLDAMLEVAGAGISEMGSPELVRVALVMLFGEHDLGIASSRHLPTRDQKERFQGREGALAEALSTAEPVIVDKPAEDPELGQLVAMHACKQAVVVPLRAGFENYGAAVFGSSLPDAYTEDHYDLLVAICNQAIVALQNAQLYESLIDEKERIVQVEEDARKKLARDLHDGPTQTIAAMAMRLNYARVVLKKNPDQICDELAKIEELARRTTKEIRHLLFTLRPLILETQGLPAALRQYLDKLAEMEDLPIQLEAMSDVDQLLSRDTQGVIFYIVEEAIGNARKHAQANNIYVRLLVEGNNFVAEIEDDGVGFDVDNVQIRYDERGSLGMLNMYERADLIGGELGIVSAPGEGTRIRITVPLSRR
jgi:signal transduction histidine kinase